MYHLRPGDGIGADRLRHRQSGILDLGIEPSLPAMSHPPRLEVDGQKGSAEEVDKEVMIK